jgi:tetratricopeptide (TPR) repeat protein
MLRALFCLLVLAAGVAVAAGPASAEDRATKLAKKHFSRGEKLFALGRFDDALLEYEAAFEAKPLPGFLFNIGQCHRNLGDYDEAIFSFRKYLKLEPDAENKDAVLSLIEDLEDKKRDAEAEADAHRFDDRPPPDEHPRSKKKKKIYQRWWFWGGVAGVAAASTGTFLLLSNDGLPSTDLGNVVFR